MNHDTLTTLFWVSLAAGTPLGILCLVWWGRKMWPRIMHNFSRQKTFVLIFPGLILLVLCHVPVLFFNHLLKQERYCIQVIQINKGVTRSDPFFAEQCAHLNLDELFEKAKSE